MPTPFLSALPPLVPIIGDRTTAAEADRLFNIYRARIETWPQKVQDGLANIVSERIAAEFGGTDAPTDQGELV